MSNKAISVFYSYSHKDETFKETFDSHMSSLKRSGKIKTWNDRCILPGQNWEEEIDSNLRNADIVILLISKDFIDSDYCYSNELSVALDNHKNKKSVVIPIILKPVHWTNTLISSIQALPKDATPVTKWENQDEAWTLIAQNIEKTIDEIAPKEQHSNKNLGLLSINDVLENEINRLDAVFNEEQHCSGLSTGFDELDCLIDGIHKSQLILIAARPSMGKTTFSLNIATHTAIKNNATTAFFSMKLTSEQLTRYMISSIGDINTFNLLRGTLIQEDWGKLNKAINTLSEIPFFIDESANLTLEKFEQKVIKLKQEYNLKLVVIDSLEQIALEKYPNTKLQKTSSLTNHLKRIALETGVSIVITATLYRSLESRPNKRPTISDLAGYNEIDVSADTVLFLYRDEMYNRETEDYGLAELIVAKNSNGYPGVIRLKYNEELSKFENLLSIKDIS